MMLAASMCFAEFQAGHVYSGGAGGRFHLSNDTKKAVSGFKFYYYFNGAPGAEFSADIKRYEAVNQWSGNYIADNAVLPRSVTFERLSGIQYRAVLDYSNVRIPAGGGFPQNGSFSLRIYDPNDEYGVDDWSEYGHVLLGYVIESLSGQVLFSMDRTIPGHEHLQIDNQRRVGLLTDESTCSDYASHNPRSIVSTIKIDVENSGNQTKIASGNTHPLGVEIRDGYIKFKYCSVAYERLPRVPFDYIVLKLDSECPQGSYPFTRYHDAEDNNNMNESSGYIWPNIVDADAELQYCFVPKDVNATRKYPFDKKYGVFAYHSGTNIARSQIYIDDEDSGNSNYWNFPTETYGYQTDIGRIMYGTANTNYFAIKWTGSNNAMLAKSSGVASADNIAVENTLVAAAPLAPAVKGMNRSVVAVDLKSAGDVKVSIVGVNGAVVANIAEKNLQAGSHQIKWNAGMVPSGRYIVKVEQNGMVNAKNVILK